jgi:hypothetical protein
VIISKKNFLKKISYFFLSLSMDLFKTGHHDLTKTNAGPPVVYQKDGCHDTVYEPAKKPFTFYPGNRNRYPTQLQTWPVAPWNYKQ